MEHADILLRTRLFSGFDDARLEVFLQRLHPIVRQFAPGEVLLLAGSATSDIGILLEGRAEAQKLTPGGREFTVTELAPGGVYGDILFASGTQSPVTVTATCACRVLLLPYARLFSATYQGDGVYVLFLQNLLREISEKYFALDARVDLLLTHGLRRRICTWLTAQAKQRGGTHFAVPLTRAALAAHLGCERSALSRELSRMAKEGLIETKRGSFTILAPEAVRRAAKGG